MGAELYVSIIANLSSISSEKYPYILIFGVLSRKSMTYKISHNNQKTPEYPSFNIRTTRPEWVPSNHQHSDHSIVVLTIKTNSTNASVDILLLKRHIQPYSMYSKLYCLVEG